MTRSQRLGKPKEGVGEEWKPGKLVQLGELGEGISGLEKKLGWGKGLAARGGEGAGGEGQKLSAMEEGGEEKEEVFDDEKPARTIAPRSP